jgi:hypothetical protein
MLEFIKQYVTTVLAALVIMSVAYLIFWVIFGKKLSNRKIQLSKRAGWSQIKGEIGATLFLLLVARAFRFSCCLLIVLELQNFTSKLENMGYGMRYLFSLPCYLCLIPGFIGVIEPCTTQVFTGMYMLYTIKVWM